MKVRFFLLDQRIFFRQLYISIGSLVLIITLAACTDHATVAAKSYDSGNAHSHNDYAQKHPFWEAYDDGFGSIEADVFVADDSITLLVAHNVEDTRTNPRTLDSLYLQPLIQCIRRNDGTIYPDPSKHLQLLIDFKTSVKPTITALINQLERYPELINCRTLTFVISGNRPDPSEFASYPEYLHFDGRPSEQYTDSALARVGLISVSFQNYSNWDGKSTLAAEASKRLLAVVDSAHQLGKPFRFWATPDTKMAWEQLKNWGVDYINTDQLKALSRFLKHK